MKIYESPVSNDPATIILFFMWRNFFDLLFPNLCRLCNNLLVGNERLICTSCRMALPTTHFNPFDMELLARRLNGQIPFRHVLAYMKFYKSGITQTLLHQLKYGKCPELGVKTGQWFGFSLIEKNFSDDFDMIIPVPLHKKKLRQRGYNQSERIAAGIAEISGLVLSVDAIERIRMNESQTNKSRLERWHNVENIFCVTKPELIRDKNVLLIDDVITTGATIESCAMELMAADVKSVSAGALAMAM